MYSASFSVTGDWLCGLRISMMLAEGRAGRPSLSSRMRRLPVSRLRSCTVTARPALTTANSADRLGLL
ncbi:Uncharacterised protein [Acinetobacter baumannii]|nr:Uncharacterised protein [Acinetobacter baumannii]